jgi:all-trans-retinol 13,14-reductase
LKDDRKPRKEYITDQKKRDAVIKQSFHIDKVPKDLDAIIIGSGIGGLSTASIMAKAGKKVLVLEQHDQAGGCCHTFIDKVSLTLKFSKPLMVGLIGK